MSSRRHFWFRATRWLGLALGVALPLCALAAEARLLCFTNFAAFTRTDGAHPGEIILTSPELAPGFAWRELIVSWNAATNVALTVEARPVRAGEPRFYSFGQWTAHPGPDSPRTSARGQKDAAAEMDTDTLRLKEPAERAQVRVTVRGGEAGLKGLRRLAVAFSHGRDVTLTYSDYTAAWGIKLPVPVRSQADYPEGVTKWCSPTCTTMLLAFWSEQRHRPDWLPGVPETAAGVFDPGWGGTGNWPFNTAFAGSHAGLNAVVARFPDLHELERWLAAGLPAATSISYALAKGGAKAEEGDGHLVVVRGFTRDGDVRVNDPGVRREWVQRIFKRYDFARAWAHSGYTVYLVWPDGQALPKGPAFPR